MRGTQSLALPIPVEVSAGTPAPRFFANQVSLKRLFKILVSLLDRPLRSNRMISPLPTLVTRKQKNIWSRPYEERSRSSGSVLILTPKISSDFAFDLIS